MVTQQMVTNPDQGVAETAEPTLVTGVLAEDPLLREAVPATLPVEEVITDTPVAPG